jgi:hypothetical protein
MNCKSITPISYQSCGYARPRGRPSVWQLLGEAKAICSVGACPLHYCPSDHAMAQCNIIAHTAKQALSALHHRNTHYASNVTHLDSPGNPFLCPYCPKSLLSKGGRTQHIERSLLCKKAHQIPMRKELEKRKHVHDVMNHQGSDRIRYPTEQLRSQALKD